MRIFESEWLDFDGSTYFLERDLKAGVDVLARWPEVKLRGKYGHMAWLMSMLSKRGKKIAEAEKRDIGSEADDGEENGEDAEEADTEM